MNVFGVVAGVLVGLGVASAWQPRTALGRAGTLGVFLAAASFALLVPAVSTRLDNRVVESLNLLGAAAMLHRALLIAAVAAWCVHLLRLLAADLRVTRGVVVVAVLAAAVVVWQWTAEVAIPPAVLPADVRWYHLAFAVGLGIPQLVVLVRAAQYRAATTRPWPAVLACGALAGVGAAAEIVGIAFAPEALAAVPGWVLWLLLAVAGILYWCGSVQARSDTAEQPVEDDLQEDDLDVEGEGVEVDGAGEDVASDEEVVDDHLDDAGVVVPAPSRVLAPADSEGPSVVAEAQWRAAGAAVALAQQLEDDGRSSAVAVGASGDRLVFVTADGLGYLPEGGHGADDLTPLIVHVPDEFILKWLGYAHPQMPLLAAAEKGHIDPLRAVVTVSADRTITGIELGDGEEIDPTPLSAPRSRTDSVPISEAHSILAGLQQDWAVDPDIPVAELTSQAAAARWTTRSSSQYPHLWIGVLCARATDYFQAGDVDSAQYCLASAMRIPRPEPAPAAPAQVGRGQHSAGSIAPPPAPPAVVASTGGAAPAGGAHDWVDVEATESTDHPGASARGSAPPPAPEAVSEEPQVPLSVSLVASLADQIPGDAEIAVAVAIDGSAVFATSYGLGHLPAGAQVDARVVPLAMRVDARFATDWLGCDVPHRPLLAAIDRGFIPAAVEIATTSQKVAEHGVISSSAEVLESAPRVPLTVPRDGFAQIQVDDVDQALQDLAVLLGPPVTDVEGASKAAEAARWLTDRNPDYLPLWTRYLHAAAAAAVAVGDLGSARYLLGGALLAASVESVVGD